MRDPLENIVIGNFLYGLGLSMGQRAGTRAPTGCVNLLQQTPMDRPLGDVYIRFPGAVRLFEFKRASADKTKESRKLFVLQAALKRRPDLRKLSQGLHWYVETKADRPEFHFGARPYLDMHERKEPELDFAASVKEVVDQALSSGPVADMALVQEYLDAVARFAGKKGGTSSGMLVAIDQAGGIRWVAVDDVRDLRSTPRQLIREMQTEQERMAALSRAPQRDLGFERDGPTFDR